MPACVCTLGGAAFPDRAAGAARRDRSPESRDGSPSSRHRDGLCPALPGEEERQPAGLGTVPGGKKELLSPAALGLDGAGAASRPVGAAGAAPLRRRHRPPPRPGVVPPPPRSPLLPGGAGRSRCRYRAATRGAGRGRPARGGAPGGRRSRSGAGLPALPRWPWPYTPPRAERSPGSGRLRGPEGPPSRGGRGGLPGSVGAGRGPSVSALRAGSCPPPPRRCSGGSAGGRAAFRAPGCISGRSGPGQVLPPRGGSGFPGVLGVSPGPTEPAEVTGAGRRPTAQPAAAPCPGQGRRGGWENRVRELGAPVAARRCLGCREPDRGGWEPGQPLGAGHGG